MTIRLLSDRIVVKLIDEQEATRHGVIIPDSATEKLQEGESKQWAIASDSRTEGSLPSTSKPATAPFLRSTQAARPSWTIRVDHHA
jgi:Chaperonin 10 Kd subunit